MADIAIFPTCCCCEHAEMWTTLADYKEKYRKFEFHRTRIEEIVKN